MNLKMAYADPPYPGQAKRHYSDHPDYAGEVDHAELIERLERDYTDGWALSTSSPALRDILPLCPSDVRVMAWVKPFCSFKSSNPAYTWEPVLVRGGRKRRHRQEDTVRDWIAATPPVFRKKGLAVKGQKPDEFCFWLFAVLNLLPGDQLDDLFPGSGAVSRAWRQWCGAKPEVPGEQSAFSVEAA